MAATAKGNGGWGVANEEVAERLSEETLAFAADLTRDGEVVGEARNRGRGGPNMYHFESDEDEADFDRAVALWWERERGEEMDVEDVGLCERDVFVERLQTDADALAHAEENGHGKAVVVRKGFRPFREGAEPPHEGMWEESFIVSCGSQIPVDRIERKYEADHVREVLPA